MPKREPKFHHDEMFEGAEAAAAEKVVVAAAATAALEAALPVLASAPAPPW